MGSGVVRTKDKVTRVARFPSPSQLLKGINRLGVWLIPEIIPNVDCGGKCRLIGEGRHCEGALLSSYWGYIFNGELC